MIDLHTHTHASDGTLSPAELVEEALRVGVRVLGITDHDTFAGHDEAVPYARAAGIELVCGIELSTKLYGNRSVHLLGYFLDGGPSQDFREWILDMQAARRERNVRLTARLRQLGFDITLEEVQARGRGMTARPHFAQVMLEKGYVTSLQQAFDEYLDESAVGYVYRREPSFAEGVRRIRDAGGITSLAHPVRVPGDLTTVLPELCAVGLDAIEVYHSDHSRDQTDLFLSVAVHHGLLITGGSDFHGSAKPGIALRTGRGNLDLSHGLWQTLRSQARRKSATGYTGNR